MDFFSADLEIKTVDVPQRLIAGYAAAHHNIDRVRDIIDPSASPKAVARLKAPSDAGVFIGHNSAALPIGIPQRIEATPRGLYTETYVLKGPAGDNLLAVAKDLQDHGQPLGMSIGYKTHDSRHEQTSRGRVRRILDYELKEYSFAAHQAIANPEAVVTSVKARRKAMGEGSDAAGGALVPPDEKGAGMHYSVRQQGDKWAVTCDDGDADADEGRVVGTYDDEVTANAVAAALRKEAAEDDDEADEPEGGKTAETTMEQKAEWDTAYVNDLPNSAFLFVEPGEDDSDGKRVPRSKRHFPYKDASGKVDLPHLRNAIARIPQSDAPGLNKDATQARARRMLESANGGDGKTIEDPEEWKSGVAPLIRHFGYRLLDLSEALIDEHKAMALLGEQTKGGMRIRPEMRDQLGALMGELKKLVDHAERIDAGEDGKARMALLRQRLALAEL